jgi:TolA-binding protein
VPGNDSSVSRLLICVLAFGALAFAGCADDTGMQQLNQNQFTLRGMIANDRQEIDSLQQQVRALKEQMNEHGGGGGVSNDQLASINDRLNKIESQVSGLQAGMSATPVGAAPVAPAPGLPVASVPPGTTESAPPPAAAPEVTPTWPQDLDQEIAAAQGSREQGIKPYREGLTAMKSGKYPTAVAKFTELSHHFPRSPLVTPAEYFTANALFESGKYDQAILQFNDVVMRDPKGKYASQSLLREAQAFLKLNPPDNIDARLTLQKLLADHSDSPEAPTATAMMKSLAS